MLQQGTFQPPGPAVQAGCSVQETPRAPSLAEKRVIGFGATCELARSQFTDFQRVMVLPEGFEPPTSAFEARRSNSAELEEHGGKGGARIRVAGFSIRC